MKTRPCIESKPGPPTRSKFANLYIVVRTAIGIAYVSFYCGSSIVTGCSLKLGALMYSVVSVLKESVIRSLFLQSDCRTANNNNNKETEMALIITTFISAN
jgi:hypothetical protein